MNDQMNILVKPISSPIYRNNKFFEIDTLDNVFFGFKRKLKKLDITINTLDVGSKEDVDCIVFCDIPYFWQIGYIYTLLKNRKKNILFCFEPPVINPFNHWRIFFIFFRGVYTWNDLLVDNKKIHKFYLPVRDFNPGSYNVPFKKKKLLCLVNSNKSAPYLFVVLSQFKKLLYQERLRAIHFFENEIPLAFDLYGRGWNQPKKFNLREKMFGFKKYASYQGAIPGFPGAKLKVISNYKFNLCFENCIVEGYISEKIIDCFKSQTVPIYFGAPNIEKYIPKNCFIDFRDFKDYQSLLDYLINMDEKTYNTYIRNAKRLVNTKKFKDMWFEEGFLKVFLESISYEKSH